MPKLSPAKQWERCHEYFKANATPDEYATVFSYVLFDSFNAEKEELVLRLPSNYYMELLRQDKYKHLLYRVVWHVYGSNQISILYRILTDSTTNATHDVKGQPGAIVEQKISSRTKKVTAAPQDELDSQLNDEYTFENFIEGDGNKLLRSVGQSIADNPKQTTFNPLFVYGSSGVGKTHLVNAIGIRLKKNFPDRRVLYVSANLLKVQYMSSVKQNLINDFIMFYQTIDVLIIDDIQELATLKGTQQAFFHIFNHLKMNGKQIIMTSDQPPSELQGMEERLLTRFKWGLAAELEKPDRKLCHKILESKVRQEGLNLSQDVIDYIADNVSNSVRDLEGIVNSLIAHSIVYNRDIDLPMAEQIVGRASNKAKKKITIEQIVEKLCEHYEVNRDDVMSKGRKASIVLVRQLAMYLAQKLTGQTSSKIGLAIGNRNHATVIHAVNQIKERISVDKNFAEQVTDLISSLKS